MQTLKNRFLLVSITILLAIIIGVVSTVFIKNAFGNVTAVNPTQIEKFENYTFFATSTATFFGSLATSTRQATSTNITPWYDSNGRYDDGSFYIAGAKKVQVYLTRGATTTSNASVIYSIQGTPDGTSWYNFPKLVLATSTTKTTQANFVQTAATTTVPVALDLADDTFYAIRCIVTYSDPTVIDGNAGCSATAEF